MIDIKPKNILQQPIYLLTKATPCPYLKGRVEKRIATELTHNNKIYNELALNGFRRVENWMYRPICDNCSSCKSYRVEIKNFKFTKSLKRVAKNLSFLNYKIVKNSATLEHFQLFQKYQQNRHSGGSMSEMDEDEFTSMIETSPIQTSLMEFRDTNKKLIGVVLLDISGNDLSAVYSFFDPSLDKLGVGNFMITQGVLFGQKNNYNYLYLGYYVKEITSMSYKKRFKPGQILENNDWVNI